MHLNQTVHKSLKWMRKSGDKKKLKKLTRLILKDGWGDKFRKPRTGHAWYITELCSVIHFLIQKQATCELIRNISNNSIKFRPLFKTKKKIIQVSLICKDVEIQNYLQKYMQSKIFQTKRKRRAKHDRYCVTLVLSKEGLESSLLLSFPLSVLILLIPSPTHWKIFSGLPTSIKFQTKHVTQMTSSSNSLFNLSPTPFGRGDVSIAGLTLAFESPCQFPRTDLRPKCGTMAPEPEQSMLHNSAQLWNLSH